MDWKCERCGKDVSLDKGDYGYINSESTGDEYDIRLCLECKHLFNTKYNILLNEFMNSK